MDETRHGGLHRWTGRPNKVVPSTVFGAARPAPDLPTLCAELLGLFLSAARQRVMAAGLASRVTRRDGFAMIGTRDYRRDRINLQVDNGIVTSARVG